MATTVATAASTVKDRLLLDNSVQSAPPSDAVIQAFVRDAFRYLFGALQPVFQQAVTLDEELKGTLTTPGYVLYVSVQRTLLFPIEWTTDADELFIEGHNIASNGDVAHVCLTTTPDLSGETIESSCVFGSDWLEPPALLWAEMMVLKRLSGTSNSATGQYSLTQYRVLEESFNGMLDAYRQARRDWLVHQDQRLSVRAQMGRPNIRDSALHQGWNRDGVRARNSLTGRR